METQTVNNDGFDQEATNTVEDNYDSSSSQEETNLEGENLGQEGLEEETQEPKWQEGDPLNLHPRFQEVTKANRELKERLEQFEQQFSQLQAQIANGGQEKISSNQQEVQRYQDIDDDPEFVEIFSSLPDREFPEPQFDEEGRVVSGGFNSFKEQYQYILKYAVKDLAILREKANEKYSQQEQQLQTESKSLVDGIKKSFGTDESGFQSFAKWAESKYEKGSKLDLQELHSIYVEDVYKKPDLSKVSKLNRSTSGKIGGQNPMNNSQSDSDGVIGWDNLEL